VKVAFNSPGTFSAQAEDFVVILIQPEESRNVGSVCRAMSNFGFQKLRLVDPKQYDKVRASHTACNGSYLLEQLEILPTLEAALADQHLTVGFAPASGRGTRAHLWSLKDWAELLPETLTTAGAVLQKRRIALVFGAEERGLSNDEIALCHDVVSIPTHHDNNSLNLAQAVLTVLYELSRGHPVEIAAVNLEPQPTNLDYFRLDELVHETLTLSGFYSLGTPDIMTQRVKAMFRRISPNKQEMQTLLGVFNRCCRALKEKRS